MSDVYCTNCGEPWDWWFLHDELVHETNLDEATKAMFLKYGSKFDVVNSNHYRRAFREIGWVFGENLAHIQKCSACGDERGEPTLRTQLQSALNDILGNDVDGIMSEMEDAEWMFGDELDQ